MVNGDGELMSWLKETINDLGLAKRVHFAGWVPDLRIIYAAMDVLAIASRAEGMPISAIEAMASGVPVVATAVGGVPDLLEGRGKIVLENTPEAFAQALIDTILNPPNVLEPMLYIKANHSMAALGDDTEALYRELLEIPASTPPS